MAIIINVIAWRHIIVTYMCTGMHTDAQLLTTTIPDTLNEVHKEVYSTCYQRALLLIL